MDLVNNVLSGNKRSIARLITLIEERSPLAVGVLREIYKHTGQATVIGITGPPGAGKSTLVNALTRQLRGEDKRVGIIAIDPTSPFTGGALLGDRIRMQDLALDEGVFIRSMGSRGALGGLSRAAFDAVRVFDAAGMDYIIIETVGVGQSEVDIMRIADIVLLVLMPGMGDEVQAIKAGVMEIGDIYVVNKSDKDGVDRLVLEIEMSLDLNPNMEGFKPPVVKTVATNNKGITELRQSIHAVMKQITVSNQLLEKRRSRAKRELIDLVKELYFSRVFDELSQEIDEAADLIIKRELDPYAATEFIIKKIKSRNSVI